MRVLAFDTSLGGGSVAVVDGGVCLARADEDHPRALVERLLAEHSVRAVVHFAAESHAGFFSTLVWSVENVHAARPCSQSALSPSMRVPSSPKFDSRPPCSRSRPWRSQNGTVLSSRPVR